MINEMADVATSCVLVCLQKLHEPIPLPDGESVTVGRSPITKITDPRCSRNQIELKADWNHKTVSVKQLGLNASTVDGCDIGHQKETSVDVDSTLFILSGQYPHKVIFQSYPKKNTEIQTKSNINGTETKKNSHVRHVDAEPKKKSSSNVPSSKINSKEKCSGTKSFIDDKSEGSKSKACSGHSGNKRPRTESLDSCNRNANKDKKVRRNSDNKTYEEDYSDEEKHLKSVAAKLEEMKKDGVKSVQIKNKISSQNPSSSKETLQPPSHKNLLPPIPKVEGTLERASWDDLEQLSVYTSKGVKNRSKIAGFDVDGTIIVTQSGKSFPTDAEDWKIAMPEIFGELKKLISAKYKIVFFTNQLGVARGKTKLNDLKTKIENIIMKLNLPIQVFIATHEGKFRKPMDGMWEKLQHDYNGGEPIDLKSSIYVGDAAGRPANWAPKRKKDFSCSDRLFAWNIGVAFKTPEEFFQQQKPAAFINPDFDPRNLRADASLLLKGGQLVLDCKEVVVLVGFPACGKSHFAAHHLKPKGYVVVNRDRLGSWQKCVKRTKEALVNSSVVVDNTNFTVMERARYIECAVAANVPCRCFVFTTSVQHCRHNERFRQMTDKNHEKINEMVFNTIKIKFKEPSMQEGFTDIVNVNFVPLFSSSSAEITYRKFLLEK